ncbi:MAG: SusC/RagA family protein, partial [Bacteroidetes bacterium]
MKYFYTIKNRLKTGILTGILLGFSALVFGQGKTIHGEIIDENGDPMPGVNIIVQGTTHGTTSGFDGSFELRVADSDVLLISFIGYKKLEVKVSETETFAFQLFPDAENLEEVVVTALG